MDSHNTGTKETAQSPPSEASLPAQPDLLTSSTGSGSTPHAPSPPLAAHEPLQHDGVFRAQVVRREGAGLPAETLIGVGQVLRPRDICAELRGGADGAASGEATESSRTLTSAPAFLRVSADSYLDVGLLEVMGPGGKQVLAHLLIEVTCVSDKGG